MSEAPRVLRIGREADNDLVVDRPSVSAHHARVVWTGKPGTLLIEDLGSTNGTAVGQPGRNVARAEITPLDTVYLGDHPIPASTLFAALDSTPAAGPAPQARPPARPAPTNSLEVGARPLVLGRDAACDVPIDNPVVSMRHARVSRRDDGGILVEDLGSSNGTFLNGRRVVGREVGRSGDTLALGTHRVVILAESPAPARDPRAGSATVALSTPTSPTPSRSLTPALALLGPVAGFLAATTAGASADAAPALAARLALGASACGLILGVAGSPGPAPSGFSPWISRALASLIWAVLAGVEVWAVAMVMTGSAGGATGLALLALAAAAGSTLGIFVDVLIARREILWMTTAALVVVLLVGTGHRPAYGGLPAWARQALGSSPSRWAFEGLLLTRLDSGAGDTAEAGADAAEAFFPAATLRMGPRADGLALAALALGLGAAAAFIASVRAERARRPT